MPGTLHLRPTELKIDNLTAAGKQRHYPRMPSAYGVPSVAVPKQPSSTAKPLADKLVDTALLQPQGLEQVLEGLLAEMEKIGFSSQDADLQTLKREVSQMSWISCLAFDLS